MNWYNSAGIVGYNDDNWILIQTRAALQDMIETCVEYANEHNPLFSPYDNTKNSNQISPERKHQPSNHWHCQTSLPLWISPRTVSRKIWKQREPWIYLRINKSVSYFTSAIYLPNSSWTKATTSPVLAANFGIFSAQMLVHCSTIQLWFFFILQSVSWNRRASL